MHRSSKPTLSQSDFYCFIGLIMSIVIILPHTVRSATKLSGSIGGMTLTAEAGPYIVADNITVPKGESAVIKEGCRFFFKPFSGIIIDGDLNVAGTQNQPVLFTSINDSLSPNRKNELPNPFDWNGIHVKGSTGKVIFSYFTLAYSVYGIKCQNESIVIDNGIFLQNGQYHFTIKDTPMQVADGILYSYSGHIIIYLSNGATSGEAPVDTGRSRKGAVVTVADNTGELEKIGYVFTGWNSSADGSGNSYTAGTSIMMGDADVTLYAEWKKSDKPVRGGSGAKKGKKGVFVKKGVPIIIGAAGVGCGAVSLVFLSKWLDQQDEYRKTIDPGKQQTLNDDGKLSSSVAIGMGAASAIAISTGIVLYLQLNKRVEKRAAMVPVILPGGAGVSVAVNLRRWEKRPLKEHAESAEKRILE